MCGHRTLQDTPRCKTHPVPLCASVWLMPDNNGPGEREDLLAGMIRDEEPAWPRARETVEGIPKDRRAFKPPMLARACLYAWLATREEPRHIGLATKAGGFNCKTAEAVRFVNGLRRCGTFGARTPRAGDGSQPGAGHQARGRTGEGWRPARRATFTAGTIQSIFRYLQSSTSRRRHRPPPTDRASDEWLMEELSETLEISKPILFGRVRKGWLTARKSRENGPVA